MRFDLAVEMDVHARLHHLGGDQPVGLGHEAQPYLLLPMGIARTPGVNAVAADRFLLSLRDRLSDDVQGSLSSAQVTRNDRRDMLFLLAVLYYTRLPLLGKAGQELGMEHMPGATRPGQFSLFRQGLLLLLYELLPTLREDRLRALITRFGELLRPHALFTKIPGVL